jgi:hypothetical protein
MNAEITAINSNNLYKFMTILGVILFLSPSFLSKDLMNIELDIVENKKQMELLQKKADNIDKRQQEKQKEVQAIDEIIKESSSHISSIGKAVDYLSTVEDNIIKNGVISQETKLKFLKIIDNLAININDEKTVLNNTSIVLDALKLETDNLSKEIDDSEIININIKYELEKVKIKLDNYNYEFTIDTISRVVGALLFILGVFLWYYKIQIYDDKEKIKKGKLKKIIIRK